MVKKRYGSIEELNLKWGTAFWSQHHNDWSEVLTPRRTPSFQNPCQALDFHRFSSDSLLDLCKMERDILRKSTPDIPITTNFMGLFKALNYWDWAKELEFTSWDAYPDPSPGQRGDLIGAIGHDLTRSLKPGRPFLLMEQVTSHVNWRMVNTTKPPGVMRLWSLQAVARGGDGVLFFQWRQSLAGAEKFHGAMIEHAPAEKCRVFREVCELGADLKKLKPVSGSLIRSRVAVILDWHTWWALELPSKPAELNYVTPVMQFHRYCFERNIAIDFVEPSSDLSGYALVIAPRLYLLGKNHAKNLDTYVRKGGTLLATFFTGIVDENERVVAGGYPAYLRKTLGLWVEEWWPLDEHERRIVQLGSTSLEARRWSEVIHLEGAESLATFNEGYLKGRPALTTNRRGRGNALYLATELDDTGLAVILDSICKKLGVKAPLDVPPGVEVTLRENGKQRFLFVLNHNNNPVRILLGKQTGCELLSGENAKISLALPQHEVAVIALCQS